MSTIASVSRQGTRTVTELSALLSPDIRQRARDEANRWIKRLRLVPYVDADGNVVAMRDRFTYRGDSLWWFTELYLHKTRRLETAISTVLALDELLRKADPVRLQVATSDEVVRDAALAFGNARPVEIEIGGRLDDSPRIARASYLTELTARLARWRPRMRRAPTSSKIAAFVHTAFWRPSEGEDAARQESYVGSILSAIHAEVGQDNLTFVGVGPHRNFRARRWWDPIVGDGGSRPRVVPVEQLAPRRAIRDSYSVWRRRHALAREIIAGEGIRAAAMIEGCDLWTCLRRELTHAALLQWPWSARVMDEAGAALDALRPEISVTYAEAGGWGRALILEARRRHIPTVGIQHGFIYHHWLNYLHEPDEFEPRGADAGTPVPDLTLLFDRYAADHLATAGHFPSHSLAVTGSAKLDDVARSVEAIRAGDVSALRRELGVNDGQHLLVLAAKFTEIGDALAGLFVAIDGMADVQLVIKTHPAETPAPYLALATDHQRVSIAPADADPARLLAAADAIVTRNSTVAIDGLVLGVPALVLGAPSNLAPFVDAGVMVAAGGADIPGALERLLYDRTARDVLLRRAAEFAERHEMRADGQAADRAARAVLQMTRSWRDDRARPSTGHARPSTGSRQSP